MAENIASATEQSDDARQMVAEARRIVGAVIHRQGRGGDEDLEAVFGLLDHALEAMPPVIETTPSATHPARCPECGGSAVSAHWVHNAARDGWTGSHRPCENEFHRPPGPPDPPRLAYRMWS